MANIQGLTCWFNYNITSGYGVTLQSNYTTGRVDANTVWIDLVITVYPYTGDKNFNIAIYLTPTIPTGTTARSRETILGTGSTKWTNSWTYKCPRYTFTAGTMATSASVSLYFSSNDSRASGSIGGEITFPIGFTDPVRGTVTATPSVFETATISWSGFAHGTSNNIASYDIVYQQSTDNANWGSAVTITNIASSALSGSYSWSGGTRGYYYRFNVIAKGTQSGTQSASGVWTAGIRKNRLPNAPNNPGYASPSSDSNGTQSSTKLYIPESAAVFAWDAASDPDGGAVTYEIQPLARDATNSAWVNDGVLIYVSGNSYSFPIPDKPRGITNDLALEKTSLSYRVRAKDNLGTVSDWVQPYYAYQRNPAMANAVILDAFVPGIVYVGVDGQWVKSELYTGVDGQWVPGMGKNY